MKVKTKLTEFKNGKNILMRKKARFNITSLKFTTQQKILVVTFLFIPLLLLILFAYLPMGNMIYYSFHDWNGYSKDMEFIGFKNYLTIFRRPEYFSVFKVSLYYFVGSFVQLALALYFATILSFKVKGKNFFKGVLFFPNLLNGVAIGFIFLYFFRPEGTLDSVLSLLGLDKFIKLWLGDVKIINISLTAASIWRYMGYNLIMFIGAIQSIPNDIYEAAELDGASGWHKFIYIIFPNIKKIIELNMILSIQGAISVFEIPYIMTGGGNGSKTFVIQTVETAFKFSKVGLGSAMATILLLIVIIVTLFQKLIFKDKEA